MEFDKARYVTGLEDNIIITIAVINKYATKVPYIVYLI